MHVQSTRHADLAFCGFVLHGPKVAGVQLGALDESVLVEAKSGGLAPVAYVTMRQARGLVRSGQDRIPLHPACVLNLGRFLGRLGVMDDALLEQVGVITEEDDEPARRSRGVRRRTVRRLGPVG